MKTPVLNRVWTLRAPAPPRMTTTVAMRPRLSAYWSWSPQDGRLSRTWRTEDVVEPPSARPAVLRLLRKAA